MADSINIFFKKRWIKEEIGAIILSAIPFIYLAIEWNNIPDQIPKFWKWQIHAGMTSKSVLFLLCILPFLCYHLLLIPQLFPLFGSKNKIAPIKGKYFKLKMGLAGFLSLFSICAISYFQIYQYG